MKAFLSVFKWWGIVSILAIVVAQVADVIDAVFYWWSILPPQDRLINAVSLFIAFGVVAGAFYACVRLSDLSESRK